MSKITVLERVCVRKWEREREREAVSSPWRDDEHFRRLVSCRAIKKWTMSRDDITRGSELRYGKAYVTAGRYSVRQKPDFLLHTERELRLSCAFAIDRSCMRATLIFDKCRGEFYSVPMSRWRHYRFRRRLDPKLQLRRGFYTTKCPAQSIFDHESERWSFHERFRYKFVSFFFFFFHRTQYRSCHYTSLALVQLPIFQFSSLYFLLWMTNCQLSSCFYFLLGRMIYFLHNFLYILRSL